jgi:hypothetical protein
MIHWSWFKYDNFRFHKLSFLEVIIWKNLFSPFPNIEAWKGVFLDLCLFKSFFFQHHIHKWIFNTFFTNMNLIVVPLNLNSIEPNINPIVNHSI